MKCGLIEYRFQELAEILSTSGSHGLINYKNIDQAVRNGFASLIYTQYSLDKNITNLGNEEDVGRLRQAALISEATAVLRLDAMSEILQLANSQGISIVLMKGFALAHQVYPSPGNRPSSDIDIFINSDQISSVVSLLNRLEYVVDEPVTPSMISFQFSATKLSNTGHTIVLDMHYRINNQAEFEGLFEFSDIYSKAISLPSVSTNAKALCLADAYVYACVHLQGHYLTGDPIKGIWLYDIHLILHAMTDKDISQALIMLRSKSLAEVCHYWTDTVEKNFKTTIPPSLLQRLVEFSSQPKRHYAGANPIKLLWDQFVFMPNHTSRKLFLKQLFFPSKQRIREKYPHSTVWLPILYLRRAASGFWWRLRKIGK